MCQQKNPRFKKRFQKGHGLLRLLSLVGALQVFLFATLLVLLPVILPPLSHLPSLSALGKDPTLLEESEKKLLEEAKQGAQQNLPLRKKAHAFARPLSIALSLNEALLSLHALNPQSIRGSTLLNRPGILATRLRALKLQPDDSAETTLRVLQDYALATLDRVQLVEKRRASPKDARELSLAADLLLTVRSVLGRALYRHFEKPFAPPIQHPHHAKRKPIPIDPQTGEQKLETITEAFDPRSYLSRNTPKPTHPDFEAAVDLRSRDVPEFYFLRRPDRQDILEAKPLPNRASWEEEPPKNVPHIEVTKAYEVKEGRTLGLLVADNYQVDGVLIQRISPQTGDLEPIPLSDYEILFNPKSDSYFLRFKTPQAGNFVSISIQSENTRTLSIRPSEVEVTPTELNRMASALRSAGLEATAHSVGALAYSRDLEGNWEENSVSVERIQTALKRVSRYSREKRSEDPSKKGLERFIPFYDAPLLKTQCDSAACIKNHLLNIGKKEDPRFESWVETGLAVDFQAIRWGEEGEASIELSSEHRHARVKGLFKGMLWSTDPVPGLSHHDAHNKGYSTPPLTYPYANPDAFFARLVLFGRERRGFFLVAHTINGSVLNPQLKNYWDYWVVQNLRPWALERGVVPDPFQKIAKEIQKLRQPERKLKDWEKTPRAQQDATQKGFLPKDPEYDKVTESQKLLYDEETLPYGTEPHPQNWRRKIQKAIHALTQREAQILIHEIRKHFEGMPLPLEISTALEAMERDPVDFFSGGRALRMKVVRESLVSIHPSQDSLNVSLLLKIAMLDQMQNRLRVLHEVWQEARTQSRSKVLQVLQEKSKAYQEGTLDLAEVTYRDLLFYFAKDNPSRFHEAEAIAQSKKVTPPTFQTDSKSLRDLPLPIQEACLLHELEKAKWETPPTPQKGN